MPVLAADRAPPVLASVWSPAHQRVEPLHAHRRGVGALVAAISMAVPGTALAADPIFEKYKVPTVGGAEINVEVMRPTGDAPVPVILTYSPYNTLGETTTPNLANDGLGQRYVPRGYARAVADVLGTRNSSGCWDYGGADEQQSGVDLVNFLAAQAVVERQGRDDRRLLRRHDREHGRGARRRRAGARGDRPEAAISRWYGYAYGDGVRYFLNSEVPTDEGLDTPLAFDFGLARTPPTDPSDPLFADKLAEPRQPVRGGRAHASRATTARPTTTSSGASATTSRTRPDFRAAVLVAHGWQDYNVKQDEGVRPVPRRSADGVPFKRAYMFQGRHGSAERRQLAAAARRVLRAHAQGRAATASRPSRRC